MKSLRFKSVMLASLLLISGITAENVLAQGRGGRGGSASGSRGGGARMSAGGSSRGYSAGIGGRGSRSWSGSSHSNGSSSYRGGYSRGNSSVYRGGSRNYYSRPGGYYNRGGLYAGRRFGYGSYYRHGYYGRGFGRPYWGYYNYYRPYLGFSLSVLPFGYYPFFYGDAQYYYSGGLYYRQYDKEYKVVVPPVGAEVPSVPEDANQVTINGQEYFEYKGVYYSPVEKTDGKTAYIIAGKEGILNTTEGEINAGNGAKLGDVVEALPDGSREVTVKGQKLYVTEDGVYYEEIQDGDHVSYKVVGI